MSKYLAYILIFVLCLVFFSHRLIQTPQGLTGDESAFGYNAILLSETLRDENNRLLPVFVLSLDGQDWRQPVTQYFMTIYFKLFGASLYNLKFTSVIFTAITAALIYYLGKKLMGKVGGIFALVFFVTTPIIMIHAHLGLDNIAPIPFTISWLICIYLFGKSKRLRYLLLAGATLGVGFYSYKAMRSFVPAWSVLTVLYLLFSDSKGKFINNIIKQIKPVGAFTLGVLPFYLVIPFLEFKYAGAVLSDASVTKVDSIYTFLHSYLASFDPSFLYITGDTISHHSTGVHGMLLLASLPFFIFGLYKAVKGSSFWKLIVASFFLGPILFGVPVSIHRASRLIAFVPQYSLICSYGAYWFYKNIIKSRSLETEFHHKKRKLIYKIIFLLSFLLVFINYSDFLKYYWYQYPDDYKHIFHSTKIEKAYKFLYDESKTNNLMPYVSFDLVKNEGITEKFLRSIYFIDLPAIWNKDIDKFPKNAILMSNNPNLTGLNKVKLNDSNIYYYVNE